MISASREPIIYIYIYIYINVHTYIGIYRYGHFPRPFPSIIWIRETTVCLEFTAAIFTSGNSENKYS